MHMMVHSIGAALLLSYFGCLAHQTLSLRYARGKATCRERVLQTLHLIAFELTNQISLK